MIGQHPMDMEVPLLEGEISLDWIHNAEQEKEKRMQKRT